MTRIRCVILLLVLIIAAPPARAGMLDVNETDEIELGEEVARSIIAEYGLVEEEAEINRLISVSAPIILVSERPGLDYHFYIVDTEMVNAFAVPGGYIFVTRGLMDYIEDDDELAAVISHELVHISMRHGAIMYKKNMKNMLTSFLLLLLTRDPNLLMAKQMYEQGRAEIWGRQAEIDADRFGAIYAVKAGYDPGGMVSFFEKMERLERHSAPLFEGYFDVHPPTKNRIDIVRKTLHEINIVVPESSGYSVRTQTFAKEDCDDAGCVGVVMSGETELMRIADAGRSPSAYERASEISSQLNALLDLDVHIYDVKTRKTGDAPGVWLDRDPVAAALPGDAAHAGVSQQELADQWAAAIKNFIWIEHIKDE